METTALTQVPIPEKTMNLRTKLMNLRTNMMDRASDMMDFAFKNGGLSQSFGWTDGDAFEQQVRFIFVFLDRFATNILDFCCCC